MSTRRGRWLAAATGALLLITSLILLLPTAQTRGGFSCGVNDTANTIGCTTLIYSHTYPAGTCTSIPVGALPATSTFICPGGINPTYTPGSGTTSTTDAITYSGSTPASQVTEQVRMEACGPVQATNQLNSTNPMLARYAVTFATAGPMTGSAALALDGSTGYESSVLQQSQPTGQALLGTLNYGLGIWFKTTSSAGGPLFSFGGSPINVAGSNDRILYLNAAGQIGFGYTTGNGVSGLSTSTYRNGNWHFAYVQMTVANLLLSLTTNITVYVDGVQVATGGGLLTSLSTYPGYWHLGWAPLTGKSYGTGLSNYFAGSLSNFVVWNGGSATSGMASLNSSVSQTAFNAGLGGSATEHWQLDDPGTTTFGGPYPIIAATSPCTMVNISWDFTSPTSCAWSPQSMTSACTSPPTSSLAALAAAGWQSVAAPAPNTTQTSTVTVTRAGTYNASYLPGLRLYAPLNLRATAGGWSNMFRWPDASAAFVA